MLAASCELREPGDCKVMDVAGIPLLVMRGRDGAVRTFLNACTHRGARLMRECGHAARFTCPYHAWSFRLDGSLLAVPASEAFGDPDPDESRLVALPTTERAGLIWPIFRKRTGHCSRCCSGSGSSFPTCRSTAFTKVVAASLSRRSFLVQLSGNR